MNNLRETVHARISAARASGRDRYTSDRCQCALKRFLNGRYTKIRLRLPTVVMATKVFDAGNDTGTDSKGLIREAQGFRIPQCGATAL